MCYHILTGYPPFHELPDDEVENNYERGIFPELKSLGEIEVIIHGCWTGKFDSIADIMDALESQGKFCSSSTFVNLVHKYSSAINIVAFPSHGQDLSYIRNSFLLPDIKRLL